jgi:plastocyanin
MGHRRRLGVTVLASAFVVLGACSSDDAGPVIDIAASDDACVPAETDLAAGATTFRVKNDGSQVTEVYVYAEGDRVVTERENIGPGTTVDFNVDLAAGTYEIACKPGQVGDGIRQTITVTGEGGEALLTTSDLTVSFDAFDYDYDGLDALDIEAGQAVEFDMTNVGSEEHEFEVFDPSGEVLGEVGPTAAGDHGSVILELPDAGTYRYVCGIDDHEARGMVGTFDVG